MKQLVAIAVLAAACGDHHSSPPVAPDAPSLAPDAAAAIAKCSATPRKLVDGATFAPAGSAAVGIPTPQLAVDGDELYYNLAYDPESGQATPAGHIMRVALDVAGAAPETVVDSRSPTYLAIAGGRVWFSDSLLSAYSGGAIYSVPESGGSATLAATSASYTGWIATDAANAYYVDDAGVERVAFAGGASQHVSDDVAFSFGVIGSDVVLADFSGGAVSSVPAAGGSATLLGSGQVGPLYPVSCGSAICWMDSGDEAAAVGALVAVGASSGSAGSGSASSLFASNELYHPHGVVSDAANVYVAAEGAPDADGNLQYGNTIVRIAADGSTADIIVANSTTSGDIAVDDDCVYWSAFDGLYSVAKDAPSVASLAGSGS